MSLFSRFKKAPPSAAPQPSPAPVPKVSVPDAPDPAVLAAREEQSLQAAVAAKDAQAVARLVIEGTSTKIRQQAAEAIDDPALIRQLIRDARGGNDKSVYKILTRKRDALLAHEREAEQLNAEIAAASAAIERHSHRPYDAMFTPTLEVLESRWKTVADKAEPSVVQVTAAAIDHARETIAQHLRQIAVEASRELAAANAAALAQKQREQEEQATAAAAAERAQAEEEERKAEAHKHEAHAQALRQIGGLLRKAHGALASGSSKSAAGLRRALDEKLKDVQSLPAHLANQLRQLDEKLQELKDWKSFSVAPKRAELIEHMEALIGATLHPSALAGHVKDLQEKWRTLSKGAGEDVEADWQRFHEAAQKAYQPCREFFEAQDRVKQENLQQRGLLFDRLAAFEARQDWEQPDWRTVVIALREARQLWREHSPVDPAAAEELQAKFHTLTSGLQSRVDAEYSRNVKIKRSLIERARGLLDSSDSRAATDEAKRLQEQWKSVGPSREDDRKLWEEFRQQCDALFGKRQQEFASHNAALDTNKAQAIGLCEEVERIAALTDDALVEEIKRLPDLRLAFDAIEELPKAQVRQLQDRFERAFERCDRAVAQQHAREVEQGWVGMLDTSNQVRAYQLALAKQVDAAECDSLKQVAQDHIANIAAKLPKRGADALKNALSQPASNDLAANEQALRTLCIRAEIFTDTPTPAADQTLRREYQVKRLMESMGQGVKAQEGELDTLAIEWLSVGPVEEVTFLPLLERFKESRRRRPAPSRRKN